jgi:acyl carrier protein
MQEDHARTWLDRDDIVRTVKQVLIQEARVNIAPDMLADDEPLNAETLRITSLSFIGIVLALEEELGIHLEDELFMKTRFTTVEDLADFMYHIYRRG